MSDVPYTSEGSGRFVKSDGPANRNGPSGPSRGKTGLHEGTDAYPGLRQFAAAQLLPKLEAFSKEFYDVRSGEDSEALHRMRVASRRLRAALPIFAACFPQKKYEKWLEDIRRITRVLGDARDADVQIAALRKYRKKLLKNQELIPGEKKPGDAALLEGIGYLLQKIRERRTGYQKDIISALADLEKHHVIEEIRGAVPVNTYSAEKVRKKPRMTGIPPMGVSRIAKGIENLLSFGPWVQYPDAVAEHHAMRIAAKQLRYMMEIYAPVYRRGLKKPISQVMKLQEVLGELHDCDVWIDKVTLILLKERTKPRTLRDTSRPGPAVVAGLKLFLRDREKERGSIYRRFFHYWDSLNRAGTWTGLRSTLISDIKAPFSAPPNVTDEVTMGAVHVLAAEFPAGLPHSEHVSRLALSLFDAIQSIHGMDKRCRLLLESAAILHEIGRKSGMKGHPERSAVMILSDERLPFDVPERGIIALAASAHRGKVHIESYGIFGSLSPPDQRRALMLAALLRIADGLDCRHNGTVTSVTPRIDGKEVICTVMPGMNTNPEKQKASAKADLFIRLSGYAIAFE